MHSSFLSIQFLPISCEAALQNWQSIPIVLSPNKLWQNTCILLLLTLNSGCRLVHPAREVGCSAASTFSFQRNLFDIGNRQHMSIIAWYTCHFHLQRIPKYYGNPTPIWYWKPSPIQFDVAMQVVTQPQVTISLRTIAILARCDLLHHATWNIPCWRYSQNDTVANVSSSPRIAINVCCQDKAQKVPCHLDMFSIPKKSPAKKENSERTARHPTYHPPHYTLLSLTSWSEEFCQMRQSTPGNNAGNKHKWHILYQSLFYNVLN